jgi:hypothetical protein
MIFEMKHRSAEIEHTSESKFSELLAVIDRPKSALSNPSDFHLIPVPIVNSDCHGKEMSRLLNDNEVLHVSQ